MYGGRLLVKAGECREWAKKRLGGAENVDGGRRKMEKIGQSREV